MFPGTPPVEVHLKTSPPSPPRSTRSHAQSGLPSQPGTYALLMQLDRETRAQIGRLGRFLFSAGWYVYIGSARGPGGLAARLRHHERIATHLHWHVDFLRSLARPTEVWWESGHNRGECAWARALGKHTGASIPAPGFGSSDCRCVTHLFYFPHNPSSEISDLIPARIRSNLFRVA